MKMQYFLSNNFSYDGWEEYYENYLKHLKMQNQHYTPSIEDFHVGYECETNYLKQDWKKYIIIDEDELAWFATSYKHDAYPAEFRTPYLTKEQVEAEGFEHCESRLKPLCFKKEDYHVYFFEDDHKIQIGKGTPPLWMNYYFHGKCPSINDFRKITKLLGI